MAEVFNPQIAFQKPQKFPQKYGFILVLIFTLVILLIAGYLIYIYYLSPHFELYQLLPTNYDISFELKTDRFTFPPLQKKQLLENETIKEIYQEVQGEIEKNLQNLPPETQSTLKQFPHLIFFFSLPESFGLIGEIPDKKTSKQLSKLKINDWQSHLIKKHIFIGSNDENLSKEMLAQKLTATTVPYFSISVSPWLKINVQKNFFNQKYSSPTLTNLQQILWPLSLTDNNYSLELKSSYKLLELVLTPENLQKLESLNNSSNLSNLLPYLPPQSSVIFGLANFDILTTNLDKNENLRNIFQQFDTYLWLNYQISLSNLIKEIKGPLLISLENQRWQIITYSSNKELAEYYLRQYFGQFKPKTRETTLPDNTKAIEIVNNPEGVIFEEKEINGWKYYLITNFTNTNNVGYAINGNLLIISNNLLKTANQEFLLDCPTNDFTAIFSINPRESPLITSELLQKFPNITIIQTNTEQIHACFLMR